LTATTENIDFTDTRVIRHLTLAVLPTDDFVSRRPIGKIKVFIKELEDYVPITSKSGYYLFLDIHDRLEDHYTVTIESEEKYYLKKSITIREIKEQQDLQKNPGIELQLIPSASYPFGEGITLGRGTIMTEEIEDGNVVAIRKPVSGALVQLVDRDLSYITENSGDFVFYFKDLREDDVVPENARKFIRMGNNTETDLIVTCQGFNDFRQSGCKFELNKTSVFPVVLLKGA
jgi:hypothetical protein